MNYKYVLVLCIIGLMSITACDKPVVTSEAVGGNLPTTYILIKDSSFTPNNISLVAGNSITFLNKTLTEQTIVSLDSVTIPATKIAANGFFVFTKDTTGSFAYKNVAHPAAVGNFILVP